MPAKSLFLRATLLILTTTGFSGVLAQDAPTF